VGFYDEKAKVLFSGDTLFRGDCGRTDLPGGSWPHIQQSLRRLAALDKDVAVYPGHGPATTIGDEAPLWTP
jgi:glyoxylase-like metal-dependent hydrolase (beta-lactamase superfamily II)